MSILPNWEITIDTKKEALREAKRIKDQHPNGLPPTSAFAENRDAIFQSGQKR